MKISNEKIVDLKETQQIIKTLRADGKSIVLSGGCFDLLHLGHLKFLAAAKKQGKVLIIALENDATIKRLKGHNRPVNKQKIRARNLVKTRLVDYVINLRTMTADTDYLNLVKLVSPNIIAVTRGDPQIKNKQKQAKLVAGQVKIVIDRLPEFATSNLINKTL